MTSKPNSMHRRRKSIKYAIGKVVESNRLECLEHTAFNVHPGDFDYAIQSSRFIYDSVSLVAITWSGSEIIESVEICQIPTPAHSSDITRAIEAVERDQKVRKVMES